MREMANIEYHALVNELQFLSGSRLQKIYELSPGVIRLHFYTSGKGESAFLIDLPLKRAHLISRLSDAPPASQFAMRLRKKLEGSRLEKLEQCNFDRILLFSFKTDPPLTLAVELFGDGNLVLFDSSTKKIILSLHEEQWKGRSLKRGAEYVPPAAEKADILSLKPATFTPLIRSSKKQLIPALSEKINIGSSYLEEVIARSQLSPSLLACNLDDAQALALFESLVELFAYVGRPEPCIYTEANEVSLMPLKRLGPATPKTFSSLSEALETYYSSTAPLQQKSSADDKQLVKLKFAFSSQKASIQQFLKSAEDEKAKGDKLYEKFQDVDSLLSFIREENKKGREWPAIEEEARKKFPILQKIDPSKGVAVVSL